MLKYRAALSLVQSFDIFRTKSCLGIKNAAKGFAQKQAITIQDIYDGDINDVEDEDDDDVNDEEEEEDTDEGDEDELLVMHQLIGNFINFFRSKA